MLPTKYPRHPVIFSDNDWDVSYQIRNPPKVQPREISNLIGDSISFENIVERT